MSQPLRNRLETVMSVIIKGNIIAIALLLISFSAHSTSDANSSQKSSVVQQLNKFKSFADAAELFNNFSRSIQPAIDQNADIPENLDTSLDQFIIGGNSASRNEYREYALVILTDGRGNIAGLCGGSLIARNKVLTAAHCAQARASTYLVIPGFFSFNDNISQSSLFNVSRVADHPLYRDDDFGNDIAVLTLSRNTSGPVLSVFENGSNLSGRNATVIGTGLTSTNPPITSDFLQEVNTPILPNSTCNDSWQQLAGIRPVTSTMVCAGFLTDGRGSCSGDSGGPLIANINNQRVIVGTVSFGISACEFNRGTSVYARTSALSDFIRSESPSTEFISLATNIAPIVMLLLGDDEVDEDDTEPLVPEF